jgi:hypothetical protein
VVPPTATVDKVLPDAPYVWTVPLVPPPTTVHPVDAFWLAAVEVVAAKDAMPLESAATPVETAATLVETEDSPMDSDAAPVLSDAVPVLSDDTAVAVEIDSVEVLALTADTAVDSEVVAAPEEPPPPEVESDETLLFVELKPAESDDRPVATDVDSELNCPKLTASVACVPAATPVITPLCRMDTGPTDNVPPTLTLPVVVKLPVVMPVEIDMTVVDSSEDSVE